MASETDGKPDAVAVEEGIGLEAARQDFGNLVLRAGFGGERIPITRFGKQTAALVGMKDLAFLRAVELLEIDLDSALEKLRAMAAV
jgi:hypothetical protein